MRCGLLTTYFRRRFRFHPPARSRRFRAACISLALAAGSGAAQAPATVGAALPPWTPGMLDIHQIATGRGNAALFILPDGTTLLVDAGAAGDGIPETEPHPDGSRAPGEWIARYVQRHLPAAGAGLDYALITHFHADHFGQLLPASPWDSSHSYRLTGITQVGDALRIGTLIDRGWPGYDYPAPLTDSTTANYRRFIAAQQRRGMQVERFRPGSGTQIRLRHDPERYGDFEVRNIIGNGEVWTGSGEATRPLFPPLNALATADWPNENMCSLGLRVRYGAFRYFTGGDLPGTPDPGFPAWHAVETALAQAVGRVSVHVVDQHGSMGEESEPMLAALASTVLIIPSWAPSHPAPDVLKRIMNSRLPPADRRVFVTDMRPAARTVIGARASRVAGPPGHIVVRVEPGGARYWVIVLTSDDESDRVLSVSGPFSSS